MKHRATAHPQGMQLISVNTTPSAGGGLERTISSAYHRPTPSSLSSGSSSLDILLRWRNSRSASTWGCSRAGMLHRHVLKLGPTSSEEGGGAFVHNSTSR